MQTITATELRKTLFSTLEKVGAGEVIVVQHKGQPIARLVPEDNPRWQKQMKHRIKIVCSFEELIAPMDDVWEEYV